MNNDIWELLKKSVKIGRIVLLNFAQQSDEGLVIEIEINHLGVLKFIDVKGFKTSYDVAMFPELLFIIIDEVSNYQWEDVKYRIAIGDDLMVFYSKEIILKDA